MPTGTTTSTVLTDSMDDVISSARAVREQEGGISQLVDRRYLGDGMGPNWNEVSYAQLTAMPVTEQVDMDDNFQQLADTPFTITPTMIGISTFITDRVKSLMNKTAFASTGGLSMNAIIRKMDKDGLTVLDGFTTSLCGAGSTLTSGHISAATSRILSNATEPGKLPLYAVLHGFQIKDIDDELKNSIGTYPVGAPDEITARVFAEGYRGKVAQAQIFEDGNITIDSSDDAKGGVFARDAIVLVMKREIDVKSLYKPNVGGGGTAVYIYVDYAFGERSAGNWGFEIYSDASVPTS